VKAVRAGRRGQRWISRGGAGHVRYRQDARIRRHDRSRDLAAGRTDFRWRDDVARRRRAGSTATRTDLRHASAHFATSSRTWATRDGQWPPSGSAETERHYAFGASGAQQRTVRCSQLAESGCTAMLDSTRAVRVCRSSTSSSATTFAMARLERSGVRIDEQRRHCSGAASTRRQSFAAVSGTSGPARISTRALDHRGGP